MPPTAFRASLRSSRSAIERLPGQYREMLILVVMLGESYEDAAAICNCAIGTVKSRVNRARRLVMEDLAMQRAPRAAPPASSDARPV